MPTQQRELLVRLVTAAAILVLRTDPAARAEVVTMLVKEHPDQLIAATIEKLAA